MADSDGCTKSRTLKWDRNREERGVQGISIERRKKNGGFLTIIPILKSKKFRLNPSAGKRRVKTGWLFGLLIFLRCGQIIGGEFGGRG